MKSWLANKRIEATRNTHASSVTMALRLRMKNPTQIESLEGEELNIVSFVMDYVELHFNGPLIRALTNPKIETETGKYQFPESGSRDALCSFIGKKVQSVVFKNGVSLSLVFSPNEKILIPLDDESFIGPEAMHWCPLDETMQVL